MQYIADSAWRVGEIWKSDDVYEIRLSKIRVELDFKQKTNNSDNLLIWMRHQQMKKLKKSNGAGGKIT